QRKNHHLNNTSILDQQEDGELIFAEESQVEQPIDPWKVIIVDDDRHVHQVTKLALKRFTFEGKPLTFLSAYSGEEAKALITQHPDTAFIFLDVVMETNDAGLRLVKYIREDLNNKLVRIVLRTGQPGEAPEETVILNYDINDYKTKVELTQQKLVTTTIATLRSYRDVLAIEQNRQSLASLNLTLTEQSVELKKTVQSLQQTQLQLVEQEKMAMIGNLMAGVAHELNNPICSILGNIETVQDYFTEILPILKLYQKELENPNSGMSTKVHELDLDFIIEDMPKLITSLNVASQSIRHLGNSLRTVSRTDKSTPTPFDLEEGLDSTLLILNYRLKANGQRPAIQIIKDYGELPPVNGFPGQLNQVFMNILANAIDACEESNDGRSYAEIEANPNQIRIKTEVLNSHNGKQAIVRVQDNGRGMSEGLRSRIFEQGFTTKSVGRGTGLGLAISRRIVEEKHGGRLTCHSELGHGTEFIIQIPLNSERTMNNEQSTNDKL
ncbi:MAG: hybrid sensor histidine kinase/response regulator, partial [Coleofasciculus sp. C2-GNP5-27]